MTERKPSPDFEEYRAALKGVDPEHRDRLLHQIEQEANITYEEFARLCKLAHPEEE